MEVLYRRKGRVKIQNLKWSIDYIEENSAQLANVYLIRLNQKPLQKVIRSGMIIKVTVHICIMVMFYFFLDLDTLKLNSRVVLYK